MYTYASHAGAQWTGIVTTIAVEMLKANMVDAVVCVQRHPNKNFKCQILLYC
jgi:coenzyme F420-reducing hydrogenase beta subunit